MMALPHRLRTLTRYAKYATGTIFVASMTSAWYYRPIADTSSRRHDDDRRPSSREKSSIENAAESDRANETFCAPHTSPPWSRERVPLLLEWARRISIGATTAAIRLLMNTYGRYEIEDDECYRDFLRTVLGGNGRMPDQGLITVSNHRSLFDDPGVVSCLLPLHIAIRPEYNRWALCSQEYCFNDALPGLVKGYIGAGQVLPIRRGGGIDQRLLLDFGRHLACGEWCHVFPEGGVWQWEELGGRRRLPPDATGGTSSDFGDDAAAGRSSPNNRNDNGENDAAQPQHIVNATRRQRALPPSPLGKLKWGVGKLIAHAPVTPKVVPFAHRGMERLLPQDEDTGRTGLGDDLLRGLLPAALFGGDDDGGLHVRVRFGGEIVFDDLIREHEAEHGRLWKYCGKVQDGAEGRNERWHSSSQERVLYSKIVRRIETRLDAITRELCNNE